MATPAYVQRLIARAELFATIIEPMTTPEASFDYLPNTFEGVTPCLALYSGGADDVQDLTIKKGPSGVQETAYEFRVLLLALYSDNQTPPTYYEQQAADQLDKMSDELMDMVRTHRRVDGKWKALEWLGMSTLTDNQKIDGWVYMQEFVTLKMTLF